MAGSLFVATTTVSSAKFAEVVLVRLGGLQCTAGIIMALKHYLGAHLH
jgi:hypothetical protein